MKVVAGIQARMGSTRLPGKTLMDLAGKSLIQRVVERARAAKRVDEVVVLTTVDASDDPLVARLKELAIPCRRGPVDDVLQRFLDLADEFEPDYIVRITGDCPLIEPTFIDQQIAALEETGADFTWSDRKDSEALEMNLGGQSVLSVRALRSVQESNDPRDREHVGSHFFQRHRDDYAMVDIVIPEIYYNAGNRLQVDEELDLEFMRAVYDHFAPDHDSLVPVADVIRWLEEHPQVSAINRGVGESADNRAQRELRRAADERGAGRRFR